MSEEPLSRSFDAALRLIAEDLCNNRPCEVGLFDHRHEVRNSGTIEALNRHVIACNPNFRVEPIERALATGLWNGGVPFKLIDNATGAERWMQLGGGDPGMCECQRASDEEVARSRNFAAEAARHRQIQTTAKEARTAFINALLIKVRTAAKGAVLSPEQQKDFDYFLRSLPEGKPVADHSLDSALEYICQAGVVLGITIEQLTSS
jgi:hypothetical protein